MSDPVSDQPADAPSPLRLGVLISGTGRHMENLHRLSRMGALPAAVELVVSSRAKCLGVQRAREHGLTVEILRPRDHPADFDKKLADALREARVDLVCMAGFLVLWRIPPEFEGRVMNIHPALLPDFGGQGFYGDRVHRAVLEAGRTESGCTVHFADNEYDHGPTILQRRVPVYPEDTPDTLADRVFKEELLAYPEAVRLFAAGKIALRNGAAVRRP